MSKAYYYLVASLPMLEFPGKPPFSSEQFLEECQRLLPGSDYQIVKRVLQAAELKQPSGNNLLDQWRQFQRDLQNELAWIRASEAKQDPQSFIRGELYEDPYIVDVVATAIKSPDPLTAEKYLDRIRWQKLDDLVRFHYFDLECLIAYAIKLKILERHQQIESQEGKEIYEGYKTFAASLY